jgi:hypothetical protein
MKVKILVNCTYEKTVQIQQKSWKTFDKNHFVWITINLNHNLDMVIIGAKVNGQIKALFQLNYPKMLDLDLKNL